MFCVDQATASAQFLFCEDDFAEVVVWLTQAGTLSCISKILVNEDECAMIERTTFL